MTIGSSIKILLKTALINYFVLLILSIIMFYIGEQNRSNSAPDDMGGVFYTIIYFTGVYWVAATVIYLTVGLIYHRQMLRGGYYTKENRVVLDLGLITFTRTRIYFDISFIVLLFVLLAMDGFRDGLEVTVSLTIIYAIVWFNQALIRKFTLKKLSA